jgi:hypothetical protein
MCLVLWLEAQFSSSESNCVSNWSMPAHVWCASVFKQQNTGVSDNLTHQCVNSAVSMNYACVIYYLCHVESLQNLVHVLPFGIL